jgi:hypothetical protein
MVIFLFYLRLQSNYAASFFWIDEIRIVWLFIIAISKGGGPTFKIIGQPNTFAVSLVTSAPASLYSLSE